MASPHPPLSDASELDRALSTLESFLGLLGFRQHTPLRAALSWLAFFALAVAVPLFALERSRCAAGCDRFEIETFELEILVSRAVVAAVSLLCVSRNLRKYGVRKALFVNRNHGHIAQFRKQYIQKFRGFYCLLASWFGVCFLLKAAREVARDLYLHHGSWWLSVILFFACLISWSYSTLVFLSGCALFHLVGNLQIIHFENYGKVLERDLDVSAYIEEHMSLTYDLSKISHRFRIFLLLEFLIITASQFITLLQTTENQGVINLINGGDFGVLSIVQLVGIVLCLNAAAKISHRAQSLGSIASRWHALVTCNSSDVSGTGVLDNGGNAEFCPPVGSLSVNYSESDLESADYMPLAPNVQLTSSTSSYNRRQAFGILCTIARLLRLCRPYQMIEILLRLTLSSRYKMVGEEVLAMPSLDRLLALSLLAPDAHHSFASAHSASLHFVVTYVQSNTGGFTIFGWIVDRMLINTIFFIELSLAFFVLGKTITITVK